MQFKINKKKLSAMKMRDLKMKMQKAKVDFNDAWKQWKYQLQLVHLAPV